MKYLRMLGALLIACLFYLFADGQTVPDYQRTIQRGNQAIIDDNLKAAKALNIPSASDWTLNGAKDIAGYVMYNTTLNVFGYYKGGGVWQQLANNGGGGSSDLSNYVMKSRTVNGKALTTDISINKTDVGLGNADNTSDADKPVSNAQQTALNGKVNNTSLASANGVATLDAQSKLNTSQIPDALLGAVNYRGTYDASTNMPVLPTPATANKGYYWIVSNAGMYSGLTLNVGDWVISNGVSYAKVDNNNAVTSVHGRVGAVTGQLSDYSNYYIIGSPGTPQAKNIDITGTIKSAAITSTGTIKGTASIAEGSTRADMQLNSVTTGTGFERILFSNNNVPKYVIGRNFGASDNSLGIYDYNPGSWSVFWDGTGNTKFQTNLYPNSDNGFNIGTSSNRWASVYAFSVSSTNLYGNLIGGSVSGTSSTISGLSTAVNNYTISATPTATLSTAVVGSGATVSITGTNQAGIITLTTGTISGTPTGTAITVTNSGSFSYPNGIVPVISQATENTSQPTTYPGITNASTWRIVVSNYGYVSNTVYKYHYICSGY